MLCGGIQFCRYISPTIYELTMSNESSKRKLLEGFRINDTVVTAQSIINNEATVSFLNLPPYVPNMRIKEKLATWGVTHVSPIKWKKIKGTNIKDGTCFLRVIAAVRGKIQHS